MSLVHTQVDVVSGPLNIKTIYSIMDAYNFLVAVVAVLQIFQAVYGFMNCCTFFCY
jgi:hypothetical protein